MHLRRPAVALVAALSIALVSASAVFASDQHMDVQQTVTVEAYTTLTVSPLSIDFGSTIGAASLPADSLVHVEWDSNAANGITVSTSAEDFTSPEGGFIDRANELSDGSPVDGNVLATSTGPVVGDADLSLVLNVPAAQRAGTYTSTLTVNATEN